MELVCSKQRGYVSGGESSIDAGISVQDNQPCAHANAQIDINNNASIHTNNQACFEPNGGKVNTTAGFGFTLKW